MYCTDITRYIVHDPAHLRLFYVPWQPGFMPPFNDPISSRFAFPVPGKRDKTDPVVNDIPIRIRLFIQKPQNIVKVYFVLHSQKCFRSSDEQRTMRKSPEEIIFSHPSSIQNNHNQHLNTHVFLEFFSPQRKARRALSPLHNWTEAKR
jgi:hypothetical protein